MLVPKITFNTSSVGVSPVRQGIRNRIGIVGEFTRGPANSFNYSNGFTDFANIYGSDLSKGSLAYQAAYDQGARDFGIIRVLGNAKSAKGEILFSGIASKRNTIIMHLRFVGQVNPKFKTILKDPIFADGKYTGFESGRFHFYVEAIAANVATIKYKFLSLFNAPEVASTTINWANVTDTMSVNLLTDKGLDKTVVNLKGVTLQFGTSEQLDLVDLEIGQEWTIRVNSHRYEIPVFDNATGNQVVSAINNALAGADPIGNVFSKPDFSGITFELDESIAGIDSNRYYYYLELEDPDAVVKAPIVYTEDETTTPTSYKLEVTGALGTHIKTGARLSAVTTGLTVAPDTFVTAVSSSTSSGSLVTTIVINKALPLTDGQTAEIKFTHPTGLSVFPYTDTEVQYLSGGEQGPVAAFKDFYSLSGIPLVRFTAVSQGNWGNNVRLTVVPVTDSSFRLFVEDLTSINYNPKIEPEPYLIDLATSNALDVNGEINVLKSSNLIRGQFLPKVFNPISFDASLLRQAPQRLAPPDINVTDINDPAHPSYYDANKLISIALEEGFDGPEITDADYVKALDLLKEQPAHLIITPGIFDREKIKAHALTIAETSSEREGLKIAILNARPGLSPLQARNELLGLSSRRGVGIAGWSTYAGQPNSPRFGLSPDALYVGKIASIPFYVGPHARTSSGPIVGISEVDTQRYSSEESLQVFTDGRLEIIALDSAQGGFFFTNGRTLTNDTKYDKVITLRTYDVVSQDLYSNLQQYRNEPHTKLLRSQVAASINAYLSGMARANKIADHKPTICDESNNPQQNYNTNELNIAVSFKPLNAAEYMKVNFIRDSSGSFQIAA